MAFMIIDCAGVEKKLKSNGQLFRSDCGKREETSKIKLAELRPHLRIGYYLKINKLSNCYYNTLIHSLILHFNSIPRPRGASQRRQSGRAEQFELLKE